MNNLGTAGRPFLAVLDYNIESPEIIPLDEVQSEEILFDFNGISNIPSNSSAVHVKLEILKSPDYTEYLDQFKKLHEFMYRGESWLTNLTSETEVALNCTLENVFHSSSAKYRMFYKNKFAFFSPETFVTTKNNKIHTFPMKGTCIYEDSGSLDKLIKNRKELAEHLTTVDLLRNDLSMISDKVTVEKFRFPSLIKTRGHHIWQTSSDISGLLQKKWQNQIGSIISSILPAGSITGAPKKRCTEIIKQVETHSRGFYTGVAILFDGENIDSCVIIRYIENRKGRYYYKSGGGITIYSQPHEEYRELKDKIYVPCK